MEERECFNRISQINSIEKRKKTTQITFDVTFDQFMLICDNRGKCVLICIAYYYSGE